jgi:FlaG/FlaF family flagellin (archaellin)
MRKYIAAVFVSCAIASAAWCQGTDADWQGPLTPGQLLEIRGVNGSIHAVGTSGPNAKVTVTKTGTKSDPNGVNIQVVHFDGGIVVCAMYPDNGVKHDNECNPPGMDVYLSANNNDVQVEFTVEVPDGVKLGAYTVNGDIDGTSLTGDVIAATINGTITVSTTGSLQATTLRGSIGGVMGRIGWSGVRALDTSDGDIDLQIPADANVSVRASAFRGTITSDFPLNITTTRWGDSSIADGTLGADGRSLRISTGKGNITLRKGLPSGDVPSAPVRDR